MSENGESSPPIRVRVAFMDHEALYSAMLARDARFDGKFFVGVKTTGIYCRPICPAKPKRENVEFYKSATAAERAGFRPCLRCRPESAPLSPAWIGTSAIVNRALRLLAAYAAAAKNEDDFARPFGVSARHLRRLFESEIGRSPKQIADANRLDFARKLVTETALPMTEIADASGFASLRRFNDAFRKRFSRPPTELRKRKSKSADGEGLTLHLAYRPPYDWAVIHRFFVRHPIPGLESTADGAYSRVFRIGKASGAFTVSPATSGHGLNLRVRTDDASVLFEVARRVRKMFDLDSDPLWVSNHFREIPVLGRLERAKPGLRLPRGWDAFETGIATILGQLVSTTQASALLASLVEHYGEPFKHPETGETIRLFPTPERLAHARLDEVRTTGLRKETIREFSRLVAERTIDFTEAQDPETFKRKLREVKGIGAWSAEYLALRTIGDPDAFPGTDLILRRALEKYPELKLDSVRPWRSYAAIHLWEAFAETLSNRRKKTDEKKKRRSIRRSRSDDLPQPGRETHPRRERPRARGDSLGKR